MTINEVLDSTNHRPWELPTTTWKFYQEWNNAVFLHWKVSPEILPFIPKPLEIDTHNGYAWVSLVAFDMQKIRPKNLPAFKPISDFQEINIRTYVKLNGKAGVHFLSIEASKHISCFLAKSISKLPYRFSKMERSTSNFVSHNTNLDESFSVDFTIGKTLSKKEDVDLWLTERYALFQDYKNKIHAFDIHHIEWPINEIQIESLEVNYPRFNQLINNSPDRVNYSNGVQVVAWDKEVI